MTTLSLSAAQSSIPHTAFGIGDIASGGGVGKKKYVKEVLINLQSCQELYNLYRTNSTISSAITQFFRTIFRSGIEIQLLHEGSEPLNFDKTMGANAKYYAIEIFPVIKQMCMEWILYGFTCVAICDSAIIKGAKALTLIPITDYTCKMLWDTQMRLTYNVTLNNASMSPEMAKLSKNTRLIVNNQPDNNGLPSTPVALCGFRLLSAEVLWKNKLRESYQRTHPVTIFSQTPASNTALRSGDAGPVLDVFSSGAGDAPTSELVGRSESARNEARDRSTKQAFKDRQQTNLNAISSKLTSNEYMGSSFGLTPDSHVFAGEDPIYNRFVAPMGQSLERQIDFSGIEDFDKIIESIHEDFYESLGIPMEKRSQQTDRGLQLMQRKLNTAIVSFTKNAAQNIGIAFEPVLIPYMLSDKLKKMVVDDTLQNAEDTDDSDDDDSGASDPSDGSDDETYYGTSSSSSSSSSNNQTSNRRKRQRTGKNIDNNRLAERMKGVQETSTLSIVFMTPPETNLLTLKDLFEMNVIPLGLFRQLAMDYSNITVLSTHTRTEGDDLYFSEIEDQREEKRIRFAAKFATQPTSPSSPSSSSSSSTSQKPRREQLPSSSSSSKSIPTSTSGL